LKDVNSNVELVLGFFSESSWVNFDALATLFSFVFLLPAFYALWNYLTVKHKESKLSKRKKNILKNNYILVCGLGKKVASYIDSELKNGNSNILVIEKDINNVYIEYYKTKNIAIEIGDASSTDILKKLNIQNVAHIVAMAGKDTTNLENALAIKSVLKEKKKPKNFYMHIEDKDLNIFYRDGGLLNDLSGLYINMFSMSKNSAQALFLEHDIDGITREYIDTDKSFAIAVVCNTKLGLEVIGQACEIAHFPNENKLIIYCIDTDVEHFKMLVNNKYRNINKIANIELVYKQLNFESIDFYQNELWNNDVTNVVLCNNDAQINLDIAAQLADVTFANSISDGNMQTKIHIAIYDNKKIALSIENNQEDFEHFNTFAQTSKMFSCNEIIKEPYEIIAKCIHSSYEEKYSPLRMYNSEKIDKEWMDVERLSDRDSSRSQAYHIPIKLKALGLVQRKVFNTVELNQNRDVFSSLKDFLNINDTLKLDFNGMDFKRLTKDFTGTERYKKIEQFHTKYFPEQFYSIFEKIIRSEHNRWVAHHYLKGWSYSDQKNKDKKIHDCIIALDQLSEKRKHTVLYDIYSLLYIPNYLTTAKYELKIPLKIGVTGHRRLINHSKISNILKKELEKINLVYDFQEIISPLAEGADTLVAKALLEINKDIKLSVPIPIQEEKYLEEFISDKDRKEFEVLKDKASSIYVVKEGLDDNIYMNVGKEVVNKSDFLIALWDGKEANGVGGTADVIAYAKECVKPILHINTKILKTSKINYKENI